MSKIKLKPKDLITKKEHNRRKETGGEVSRSTKITKDGKTFEREKTDILDPKYFKNATGRGRGIFGITKQVTDGVWLKVGAEAECVCEPGSEQVAIQEAFDHCQNAVREELKDAIEFIKNMEN